jgi:general secretion pathway protein K
MKALLRLCETVGVSADVATRIATALRNAAPPAPPASSASGPAQAPVPVVEDPPLMPRSVSQLAWLGIDPEVLKTLDPYITILPEKTSVNANTAPREVLVAVIEGLDLATAERIVQSRQRTPFKSIPDISALTPGLTLDGAQIAVGSTYFEVRGRLRLGDVVLEQRSLVQRSGLSVIVRQRERVSARDQPGS